MQLAYQLLSAREPISGAPLAARKSPRSSPAVRTVGARQGRARALRRRQRTALRASSIFGPDGNGVQRSDANARSPTAFAGISPFSLVQ